MPGGTGPVRATFTNKGNTVCGHRAAFSRAPSLQLVQMNCISQRANRVSLMWSPTVLDSDLSSPLGTHIQVLCCLAHWLCAHHQSWFCEWDLVTVRRIMSSVVNLAVFLWIMPHSETAQCLFSAYFCVSSQRLRFVYLLRYFPFLFFGFCLFFLLEEI
jgi:hypothetical protein